MTTIRKLQTIPFALIALAVLLALIAGVTYMLVGRGILAVGDLQTSDKSASIVYVAASGYMMGGMLILLRHRWFWIVGLIVNALVIVYFFNVYKGRPSVMLSSGGVIIKTAQLLLEFILVYLIVMDWRRVRD